MDAIVAELTDASWNQDSRPSKSDAEEPARIGALFPDPLDEDGAADEIVITTRRAIGRVALVATETATRFQREAVEHDPMTWMFAPRAVFDGAAAVDACLNRDACMRGILLHGLGLGMDADRLSMDALLANDDDDGFDEHDFPRLYANSFSGRGKPIRFAGGRGRARHRRRDARDGCRDRTRRRRDVDHRRRWRRRAAATRDRLGNGQFGHLDPERGCEWDRVQTFETIAPYTIEEAYEVADAIARGDMTDLKDELGDLLLQAARAAR